MDFAVGFGASALTQLILHPTVVKYVGTNANVAKVLFCKGLVKWYRTSSNETIQSLIRSASKSILGDGGSLVKYYDQYIKRQRFEVFYRGISQNHYDELISNFKLKATGETTTSPNLEFAEEYGEVLVKFYVKPGTIDELIAKGRNARPGPTPKLVKEHFGDFIHGGRGWNKEFVRFKVESNANIPLPQVNIQLGNGKGVDIFNKNMLFFEKIN